MTWLFPLYLAGAAAVLLPILLHLRRRPPKDRVVFSSLMFLERSPQLLTRRSRLERLLLLLLRCCALVLLAMMFARPFIRGFSEGGMAGEGEAVVILLDTSASMRRGDLWQRAVAATQERARHAGTRDRLAILSFDSETRTIWSFEQDVQTGGVRSGLVQGALSRATPGWAATDIGRALTDASRSLQMPAGAAGEAPGRKRVVLISDFQEGAKVDSLRGFAWPDDVDVEVARLDAPDANNLGLSLAALDEDSLSPSGRTTREQGGSAPRVRIRNARDSEAVDFALRWEEGSADRLDGHLPGGSSRVLRAPPRPNLAEGDVLVLSGDAADFDNRLYLAPPQARDVRVIFIGRNASAERAASPLYYLTRALQPTSSLRPIVEAASTDVAEKLTGAAMAFVEGGLPDTRTAQALKDWIRQGGLAVYFFGDDPKASELRELGGTDSLEVAEAMGADYAMLGEVDASQPLLKPFADPRLRDFTKIRFWHHRKLSWKNDEANKPEVLARFDSGDPALLLWKLGRGGLLVMTSGWHPAESQLALSTKFVPLLFGWLEAAGFSHEEPQSLLVGDRLPVPRLEAGTRLTVEKPNGERVGLAIGEAGRAAAADMPGFYKLSWNNERRVVAVNLPPDESRTHAMDIHRLAELGVKLASGGAAADPLVGDAAGKQRLDAIEQEGRQRVWFWVLGLLLTVVAWETWLAGRRPRDTAAVSTV